MFQINESNRITAREFARKLQEKSIELYGSLFERLPQSHAGRVRSEVAREWAVWQDSGSSATSKTQL